jgi:hypothetical protein
MRKSEDDIDLTINFYMKHSLMMRYITWLHFNPGTELYNISRKKGKVL